MYSVLQTNARTSKVCGIRLVRVLSEIICGFRLRDPNYSAANVMLSTLRWRGELTIKDSVNTLAMRTDRVRIWA